MRSVSFNSFKVPMFTMMRYFRPVTFVSYEMWEGGVWMLPLCGRGGELCLLYTDCEQNVVDIMRSTIIDVDGQDEGYRANGYAVLIPRGPLTNRFDILADVDRASLLV